MLTGSTVEEWDTMIFLKETASPQEYDQATFRLQNQYVRTLVSGDEIIKENLKPQTLLVDFHPNRLFVLQEQKSLIFNVNTDERGNLRLKELLDDEIRISPIIVLNENQIQQVTSTDILEIISEYNSERSISDETTDIPIDMSLLHDELIKSIIERQPDFNSKAGLSFSAHDGEETEFDLDDSFEKNTQMKLMMPYHLTKIVLVMDMKLKMGIFLKIVLKKLITTKNFKPIIKGSFFTLSWLTCQSIR